MSLSTLNPPSRDSSHVFTLLPFTSVIGVIGPRFPPRAQTEEGEPTSRRESVTRRVRGHNPRASSTASDCAPTEPGGPIAPLYVIFEHTPDATKKIKNKETLGSSEFVITLRRRIKKNSHPGSLLSIKASVSLSLHSSLSSLSLSLVSPLLLSLPVSHPHVF